MKQNKCPHPSVTRYTAVVSSGTHNPYRGKVARDITDSILKEHAGGGKPAVYWSKEEQERCLISAFEKWSKKGGVWSEAAHKASVL
jgi:hypothetical protein